MTVPREVAARALEESLRSAADAGSRDPVAEALRTVAGDFRSAALGSGSVPTSREVEAALAPLRRLAKAYSREVEARERRGVPAPSREESFARLAPLLTAARGYAESGSEERALAYLRARLGAGPRGAARGGS